MTTRMQRRQNSEKDSDAIASIACGLWEQAGRPAGRALEFWLNAEQHVIAEGNPQADTLVTAQSPSAIASRPPINIATEPIWAVRSRSKGTDRTDENTIRRSIRKFWTRFAPPGGKETATGHH